MRRWDLLENDQDPKPTPGAVGILSVPAPQGLKVRGLSPGGDSLERTRLSFQNSLLAGN